MNTSSSFDLLPLFFTIFAFSQNGHLKNGVFVGSRGISSIHFSVLLIALVEQCPIRWCHSSKSFICWEISGFFFSFVSVGAVLIACVVPICSGCSICVSAGVGAGAGAIAIAGVGAGVGAGDGTGGGIGVGGVGVDVGVITVLLSLPAI